MAETIPRASTAPDDLVDSFDSYMDGQWEDVVAEEQREIDGYVLASEADPDYAEPKEADSEPAALPEQTKPAANNWPRVVWVDSTPSILKDEDGYRADLGKGRSIAMAAGEVVLFRFVRGPGEARDTRFAIIGADSKVARDAMHMFDGWDPRPIYDDADL